MIRHSHLLSSLYSSFHLLSDNVLYILDSPLLGQQSPSRSVIPSDPGSITADTSKELKELISGDRNLFTDVVRIPQ